MEAAHAQRAMVVPAAALDEALVRCALSLASERDELQALHAENARLRQLAHHDALTGILNRRGLEHALDVERARTRRSGSRVAARHSGDHALSGRIQASGSWSARPRAVVMSENAQAARPARFRRFCTRPSVRSGGGSLVSA